MKTSKNTPVTRLIPVHPVRSQAKVDLMVSQFDRSLAVPILVGFDGRLLNGTHRYRAFLIRDMKKLTPNFEFVYLEDLEGYVGEELRDLVSRIESAPGSDNTSYYVDIDRFWSDNWEFADYAV